MIWLLVVSHIAGPLMDAQTPSGMFVTPVYGWDEEISQPTGSIWGGMCLGCADLERLMGHHCPSILLPGNISGLLASTQLRYGQGKYTVL